MSPLEQGPTGSKKKLIELAAPKRNFSLGESIPIGVRYTNLTTVAMEFQDPKKTWEVQLTLGETDLPFGRILRDVAGRKLSWSAEDAEKVVLAPGAKHSFEYDAGKRWPERFVPGLNRLQVKDLTDDNETVLSNPIEIRVEYSTATFPALLGILSDEAATVEGKAFADKWVRRVYPGFATVSEARLWWEKNGAGPEVAAALAKINGEAAKP